MKPVRRLLDHLAAEMRRAADNPTPGAVHDLRVAINRATQALRLANAARRKLRAIRRHAAAVRDRDVTLQLLLRHRLPPSHPACAWLAGQRSVAAAHLARYLDKHRDIDIEPANPADIDLEPMLQDFFVRGGEAAATNDPAILHAFRIAAKRLRYTLEILEEPAGAAPLLAKLRQLQRRLGAMNDAVTASAMLESCPFRTPVAAQLAREAQAHIVAFQGSWPKTFPARAQARWVAWARAGK